MHADDCLIFEKLKAQQLSDCENSLQSKCNVIRNEIEKSKVCCNQNATSFAMKSKKRKFVVNTMSFAMMSRYCTQCWNRQMHWRNCLFFRNVEVQRLFFDANKASGVCWCCRLSDWLQNKLLTDRSKCRLVAFDRVFADLATEFDKTKKLTRMWWHINFWSIERVDDFPN